MKRRALLAGLLMPSVLRAQPVARPGYGPSAAAVTNWLRNSVAAGAIAGSPGTMPTNWSVGTAAGLTVTIVGTGTENGLPYLEVRFAGTSTATFFGCTLDTVTGIAAAQNQTWALSVYMRLVAGGLTNVSSIVSRLLSFSAVPAQLSSNDVVVANPTSAPLATQRVGQVWTIPDAGTVSIRPNVLFNFPAIGSVVDFTLRIGAPQLERSPVANAWVATSGTAASSGPRPIGVGGV